MALGTFEELQKSGIDFMTLLNENKEHESPEIIRSRAKTELVVPNFANEAKSRTKSELLSVPENESRARSGSLSLSIGAVESFEMPEVLMTSFELQLNCKHKSITQFVNLFIFLKISNEEKFDLTNPKIKEEKREIGSIKATVYWQYIKAGGNTFLSSLLRYQHVGFNLIII
jgi:hypothetical protein